MLHQHPLDEDTPPLPIMANDWPTFTTDATPKFVRKVTFSPGDTPFVRMTPGLFKQTDVTAGADVQATPKPSSDDR